MFSTKFRKFIVLQASLILLLLLLLVTKKAEAQGCVGRSGLQVSSLELSPANNSTVRLKFDEANLPVPLSELFAIGRSFSLEYNVLYSQNMQAIGDATFCHQEHPHQKDQLVNMITNSTSKPVTNMGVDFVEISDSELYDHMTEYLEGDINQIYKLSSPIEFPYTGCGTPSFLPSQFQLIPSIYTDFDNDQDFDGYNYVKKFFQGATVFDLPTIRLPLKLNVISTNFCESEVLVELDDSDTQFMDFCEKLTIRGVKYFVSGPNSHNSSYTYKNLGYEVGSDNKVHQATVRSSREGTSNITAVVIYECIGCIGSDHAETIVELTEPGVVISIDQSDQNLCSVAFEYNTEFEESGCYVMSQQWTFGDGGSSDQQSPIHCYETEGNYNGSLSIKYKCPSCYGQLDETKTEVINFNIPSLIKDGGKQYTTNVKEEVLDINATTFSPGWYTELPKNSSTATTLHPYEKAMAGLWRASESFAYNTDRTARLSSSDINTVIDGTYTAETFNHDIPKSNPVGKWLRANTISQYNPQGHVIEQTDVLGTKSATVYGYGGLLPVFSAANMSLDEVGFTSFEDLGATNISGNLVFGDGDITIPTKVDIVSGKSNVLIIPIPLTELQSKFVKDDKVTVITDQHVTETKVLCTGEDLVNGVNQYPGYSVVVLAERFNGPDQVFYGGMLVKTEPGAGSAATIIGNWAHTGTKSLKISTTGTAFSQPLIKLIPGETYAIEGWASAKIDDVTYLSKDLGNGAEIVIKDKNVFIEKAVLQGNIVEGWQQLRGQFTVPSSGIKELVLQFNATVTTYFDDIRIFPVDGNMQGYVYDAQLRLSATLDENNFATFYNYDGENNLFLLRKETERGIKTIQQTSSNQSGN